MFLVDSDSLTSGHHWWLKLEQDTHPHYQSVFTDRDLPNGTCQYRTELLYQALGYTTCPSKNGSHASNASRVNKRATYYG